MSSGAAQTRKQKKRKKCKRHNSARLQTQAAQASAAQDYASHSCRPTLAQAQQQAARKLLRALWR
jgi:hypothetical protein